MIEKYGHFMDQECAPVLLDKCIVEYDISDQCEVDEGAIFKTIDGKHIGVVITGCS